MTGKSIRHRCRCGRRVWAIEMRTPEGNVYSMLVCAHCDLPAESEAK